MSDFKRVFAVDDPAMEGAQWWQDSVDGAAGMSRRGVIAAVAIGGVGFVGYHAISALSKASAPEETRMEQALAMQRRFGWSFGAHGSPLRNLSFAAVGIVDALRVKELDLPPLEAWLRPFYAGVLAEAPNAVPTESANEENEMQPLAGLIPAIVLSGMENAFRAGAWFPSHLGNAKNVALIVDLAGIESVAFAAGASRDCSPVFSFGNWPHPNGVVDAHGVLAALAYFQPVFLRAAVQQGLRGTGSDGSVARPRRPLFCLDAQRLAPYDGDALTFDNRYKVVLPTAEILARNGISTVFHVVATANEPLREDLFELFTLYESRGITVRRVVTAELLTPSADLSPQVPFSFADDALEQSTKKARVFGGFTDYPARFAAAYFSPASDLGTLAKTPAVRGADAGAPLASYGSGALWRVPKRVEGTPNASIGLIPVVVVGAAIVGAEMARRRGTWTRASGGWGG